MKESTARTFGLIAMSVGAHLTAFGGLGFVPPPADVIAERDMEFEVYEEPEPLPEPEPEPEQEEPEPEPEPEPPKPKPKPKPVEPEPEAPPPEPIEEPPPAPEAPVDFTGVTLTADGAGSSWASAVGNGKAITRPTRVGTNTGRDRAGKAGGIVGGRGKGPSLITVKNLRKNPVPPSRVSEMLKRFYPKRASAQGIEGKSVVRIRILADGSLGNLRIKQETGAYGFGEACIKALRRSGRWRPAIDKRGRSGIYETEFTCRFEVMSL
ncbi:MAG: energy transducer TonB [Myxococcales bacterium]|nr:energy transducer TonB [Myxococcales bacterium]